jgi:hypothetical protein
MGQTSPAALRHIYSLSGALEAAFTPINNVRLVNRPRAALECRTSHDLRNRNANRNGKRNANRNL